MNYVDVVYFFPFSVTFRCLCIHYTLKNNEWCLALSRLLFIYPISRLSHCFVHYSNVVMQIRRVPIIIIVFRYEKRFTAENYVSNFTLNFESFASNYYSCIRASELHITVKVDLQEVPIYYIRESSCSIFISDSKRF